MSEQARAQWEQEITNRGGQWADEEEFLAQVWDSLEAAKEYDQWDGITQEMIGFVFLALTTEQEITLIEDMATIQAEQLFELSTKDLAELLIGGVTPMRNLTGLALAEEWANMFGFLWEDQQQEG